ncbi:MAG: succinyl-CoA--3-ketoacid-CoA transferase [Lachnospiraceae bacterium]|jgi:3-oxoacid CoA-transferase B subunit|nr:succinyl-CoA--3-ketoacid-CoA transferase [Lachnospiraceae bacterium]MCI1656862.1 succinyl-CoA--3-ketoacid-CoA transferase [Lachnospiraceae bacterium]MCI2195132.1 succinyl-CoA--3-ketoacid-CoA transferase [Lachnospiraceae bacterium]
MSREKEIIAKNIAVMLHDGDFVNLGVGIPTLVSNYIPEDMTIMLHGENGSIGAKSQLPQEGIFDDPDTFLEWERKHSGDNGNYSTGHKDLVDAGGNPLILWKGACCFDTGVSFAITRGGHLDMTVLGAMQVDQRGNLANWLIPGKVATGMGGAMDIVSGTKNVVIATTLTNKKGEPKLLKKCTLPLTAVGCVSKIVTEKCIIDVEDNLFCVKSIFPGVSKSQIRELVQGDVCFADHMALMLE